MSEAEALLQALWAEDEPPARDPAFVAEVMAETARRRFRWGVAALAPPTVAAAAVLWALAPALADGLGRLDPMLVAPAAIAVTVAWLVGLGPTRSPA